MEPNVNTSKDQKLDSGNSGSTVTSQVLEYFSNYSQSENLSRFLRGSKTKKTQSSENVAITACSRPQLIGGNRSESEDLSLDVNRPENENKELSPTSSVASNRKLEWDNGADIGYKNVQILQKSLSLPVLSSAGKLNIHDEYLRLSPEGINCSAEQVQQQQPTMSKIPLNIMNTQGLIMLPESCSGDESPVEHKNKIILSSSSSSIKSTDVQQNLRESSSSSEDIPLAVSTPFDKHVYENDFIPKLKKQKSETVENKNECMEMSRKEKNKGRIIKLQISKPIYVDCFNNEEPLYSNKNIQTSLKDLSSKLVQTDTLLNQMCSKNKVRERRDEPDIKENPSSSYSSRPNSASSPSKCESFQYLNAEEYHPQQVENIETVDTEGIKQTVAINYNCPSESKTEQENYLPNKLYAKSEEPTEKVNKGINLIKKLIKSEKYDTSTKRQYIDMIIQKIMEQNCSDESAGSFSSPKFDLNKNANSTSDLSDPPIEKSVKIVPQTSHKRAFKRNILHQNKPWIPISKNRDLNFDYKEALNFQTFSNEIVAPVVQQEQYAPSKTDLPYDDQQIPSAFEKLKKSHYTMVNDDFQEPQCVRGSGDDHHHSNLDLNRRYGFLGKFNNQELNRDKLRAEKMLRKCTDSSDSYNDSETVTRFAKNEKLHQLNWIKCEISYLSKLKNLLEDTNGYLSSSGVDSNEAKDTNSDSNVPVKKSESPKKVSEKNCEVLNAVDLKSLQKSIPEKTNTVYLITTERAKGSTGEVLPKSKLITEEELLNSQDKDLKILNNFIRQLIIDDKIETQERTKPECSKLAKELTGSDSKKLPFDVQKAQLISTTVHSITNNNNSQKTVVKRYTFEVPEENTSARKDSSSNTSSNKRSGENDFNSHNVDTQSAPSSDVKEVVKDFNKKNGDSITTCKQDKGTKIMAPSDAEIKKSEESSSQSNKSDFRKKLIHLQNTIDQKERELKEIKLLLNRNMSVINKVPENNDDPEVRSKSTSSENTDRNHKVTEGNIQKGKTKILPPKSSAHVNKNENEHSNNKEAISISSQSDYPEKEISDEVTSSLKSSCDSKTQYVSSEEKSKGYHQRQAKESQETSKTTCCCKDDQNVIFEIKDVVTKLNRLIKEENECCKCLFNKNNKNQNGNISIAAYKQKVPIAYTLILEESRRSKTDKNSGKKKKTLPLQEIRIQIPLHHKKKSKKTGNGNHRKRKENESAEYEYEDDDVPLQEYLHKNRPQFIQSAEERRKCIYELATIREQCRRKYKELLALTDGIPFTASLNRNDSKSKKLFSSAEMRRMTNKKYKHLPEVQKKLRDNKNEQIKYANRLLLNVFSKKLKDRVLSGDTNISLRSNII